MQSLQSKFYILNINIHIYRYRAKSQLIESHMVIEASKATMIPIWPYELQALPK